MPSAFRVVLCHHPKICLICLTRLICLIPNYLSNPSNLSNPKLFKIQLRNNIASATQFIYDKQSVTNVNTDSALY